MIKNYIFDFGQVIVKFSPKYMTSVFIKEPERIKEISEVVFDRYYFDRLDLGVTTDDEVKQDICRRLPKELHSVACLVYDNWYRNLPIMEGMPQLLKYIKESGGKLYLLSNISETFVKNYHTVPEIKKIFDCFDGLIFSGKIKIAKPNKIIFEYLLEKYDLKAEECVFIDDNFNNTFTAEKMGIKSILFDGNIDLLRSKILMNL